MPTKTPWAVLLCKWRGTKDEPRPLTFFKRLFTSDGVGSHNMVDFFDQMSHGAIDLSGSNVFGWYTLSLPQSAYAGNVDASALAPGQINRRGLVDLARQAAIANKVDLDTYYGVVVCMNTLTDLFGGGGQLALCDPGSFEPSALGQEMGHGYGMDHSRRDGSTADYQDRWDIMTTFDSAFMAPNAEYTRIGPGLNAANMRARGWLDEKRVWYLPSGVSNATVDIRPLHRRDLPGFLAADILGTDGARYLFEFRIKISWDAAIPRAAVLVHRLEDNRSYIMTARSGGQDLVVGDAFELGNASVADAAYLLVEVMAIDVLKTTATLRITSRASRTVRYNPIDPFERFRLVDVGAGVTHEPGGLVDGGGWIIIGGRIIHIPPWNPMAHILAQMNAYQAAEAAGDANLATSLRQHALRAMGNRISATLEQTQTFRVPAPRKLSEEQGKPPAKRHRQ